MTTKITLEVPDDIAKELIEKYDKPKAWKPSNNQDYWYLTVTGDAAVGQWADSAPVLVKRYEIGNVFKDKAAAELKAKKLKALATIERHAEQFGYTPDWNNKDNTKHFIYYENDTSELSTSDSYSYRCSTLPYYPSEQAAKKAIQEVGKEYKILFGVED